MNLKLGRNALSAFVGVAMIAGCASQTQVVPQSATIGSAAQWGDAIPACGGSRIGQAQCGVLVETGSVHPNYSGWTAAKLEKAYNLPSSSKGKGQVVAVVDAYDNPDVAKDLAQYRSMMGLPKAHFNKFNQDGVKGHYPAGNQGWGVEIDLDAQMVSASCPNCTIDLIEANSNVWNDLYAAEKEAVKLGATILSNSYSGSGGNCSAFETKGVTYLASAGDDGFGIQAPAACDDVVAVGGTQLTPCNNKRGFCETIWSNSGGGCSTEPKPPWQHDTTCDYRLANDVAAVAAGVAEYDTYGEGAWISVDGTSISSPLVAGVFGLAENSKYQKGGRTFWQAAHHKYLYKIAKTRYTEQGGWGSPKGIGAF
jgi:subtilase family serine protease